MQQKIIISTTKSKSIYGVLDTVENAESLIIFVHGFTGALAEQHYEKAAPFFNERGIDTFRFNLYGREKDARKSIDVSFKDHIQDTIAAIEFHSKNYKEIFLVGHSLGAAVLSFVKHPSIKKITLWDPTTGFNSFAEKGMTYVPNLNAYMCDYRLTSLFGKELIETWQALTVPNQIKNIQYPVKIIFAGNYNKYDEWKDFLELAPLNNNYTIIEGASHSFSEPGKVEELYKVTYEWIREPN